VFDSRVNELLDAEGRLQYPNSDDVRLYQEAALDIAWKHLRADKFFGFFSLFTIAQACCIGSKYQQTLTYRECRAKYNSMLQDLGLSMYIEPEDTEQSGVGST
jgi:hypothetical protein